MKRGVIQNGVVEWTAVVLLIALFPYIVEVGERMFEGVVDALIDGLIDGLQSWLESWKSLLERVGIKW